MPPAVLIGVALLATAAQTAASLKAQSDQTGAAKDYQNQQIDASNKQMATNRTLATNSFLNQSYQTAENLQQQRAAAVDQSQKEAIQAKQAVGQTMVSAATGGVEGTGIQTLIDDFHRQEGVFNANLQTNLAYKKRQTDTTFAEQAGQYSGRIASVMPYAPKPISGPNYFGAAAGLAGSLASTAANGLKIPTAPVDPGPGAGSVAFNKTVSEPTFDAQDVQF